MSTDPRQLTLPLVGGGSPTLKKKQLKYWSPQQLRALKHISSSSAEYIIGIDEVGVGCWAGPVTVAAVVLPKGWAHEEVVDSKRISHSKRMKAWHEHIQPNALTCCVLSQPNTAIDQEGLGPVIRRLTEGAATYCRLRFPDALVVLDGDIPVSVEGSVENVVWLPKADVVVASVSAASILAKVSRDNFMVEMAKRYPHYDFASNKGYRSEKHEEGLKRNGVCELHRMSFKPVKAYAQAKPPSSW